MIRVFLILTFSINVWGIGFEYGADDYGRIIGGEDADIENFNYQVSLKFLGSHRCGGALLRRNVVVTAAHCIHGYVNSTKSFLVQAGSSIVQKGGEALQVKTIYENQLYNPATTDYDVAVLILTRSFNLGEKIGLVKIIRGGFKVEIGTVAVVTGWGYTKEGADISDQLQSVQVPFVEWTLCNETYGKYGFTNRMSCWGYTEGGKDSCQGDSGGPLVIYTKAGVAQLAGIVSWGIGCARENFPGIYTDVTNSRIHAFISQFL